MRALTHHRYGEASVVSVRDVEAPTPRKGQVLIDVEAGGIDAGTWHLMAGQPLLMRLGTGLRKPRNPVLGHDVTGVVAALGPEVTGVQVGDAVLGTSWGGLAEQALVKTKNLALLPEDFDPLAAAALATSGLTALQVVAKYVTAGQQILVLGASGGVGCFVVQLATLAGAEVSAVCSQAKAAFVKGLGAHEVVAYDDPLTPLPANLRGRGFDVVVDIAGGYRLRDLRALMARGGTCVLVGNETGGPVLNGLERNLRAALLTPWITQRFRTHISAERAEELRELVRLVAMGDLTVPIDRTYRLEDGREALEYFTSGQARGKVVITVR